MINKSNILLHVQRDEDADKTKKNAHADKAKKRKKIKRTGSPQKENNPGETGTHPSSTKDINSYLIN
ncbi:MAG: hypothetical protein ACJ77K_02230 [Bacteroidia bacterium]